MRQKWRNMKKFLFVASIVFLITACGGGANDQVNPDSSNVVTDSAALMNTDTSSVLGANHMGRGQMRADTVPEGSNAGKQ